MADEQELPLAVNRGRGAFVFQPGSGGNLAVVSADGRVAEAALVPGDRLLAAQSHGQFVALQRRAAAADALDGDEIVETSRLYRAFLRQHYEALVRRGDEGAVTVNLYRQLVWHLCEIFFLDRTHVVLPAMVKWLHAYLKEPVVEHVLPRAAPDRDPAYWPTVYRLVLQGRLYEAVDLLSIHSQRPPYAPDVEVAAMDDKFSTTMLFLEAMPWLRRGQPLSEFVPSWKAWHEDAERHLLRPDIAGDAALRTLYQILAGRPEAMQGQCANVFELAIGEMLFRFPTITKQEIPQRLGACLQIFGGRDAMPNLYKILVAVMECDVAEVLRLVSLYMDDPWLLAHLTDLLFHSGIVDPLPLPAGCDLRELVLLDYGTSLADDGGMWQASIDYFAHCATFGARHIEEVVGRQPVDTERKAFKVMRVLERCGLEHQARNVARAFAKAQLERGSLQQAIVWYLRAGDAGRIDWIINERILQAGAEFDPVMLDTLVDSVGDSAAAGFSDALAFLDRFKALRRHLAALGDHNVGEAAACLLSLVRSHSVPRTMHPRLLEEAIEILEYAEPVFTQQQTYDLMQVLEEVDAGDMQQVRLSLVRNLARAIVV